MEERKQIYGIDLGTTYSCVATVDEYDKPIVLKNSVGLDVTPSVVYYEDKGKVIVGDVAKNEIEANRKVSFIKREIGNTNYKSNCIYPEDPVKISAYILARLVQDANESSMQNIKDVVITCPAYFGSKERQQTQQAGVVAGLNVLEIVSEPIAAAIAYGLNIKEDKNILVYDLGGGTFDVTIISVTENCIRTVALGGDGHLGGVDWDIELVNHLASEYEAETGASNILNDSETRETLFLQAEKAKQMLTSREKYKVAVLHDGVIAKIEVARETFEDITSGKLNRTITILGKVIDEAKKKDPNIIIDEVLLVGGSSIMPQVKTAVDTFLNCDSKRFDPNLAVAKGAAMLAMFKKNYKINEELGLDGSDSSNPGMGGPGMGGPGMIGPTIIDVLSKTYGLKSFTESGISMISTEIFMQDNLPIEVSSTYITVEDGQSAMYIDLYETTYGREEVVMDGTRSYRGVLLDKGKQCFEEAAILDFGQGFPKGHPVTVFINVDNQGKLSLSAVESVSKKEIHVECKIEGVRNKAEMAKAIAELRAMRIEG